MEKPASSDMDDKQRQSTGKIVIQPGVRVGRWTVLDAQMTTARGERKWMCRCDCGTERYVLERNLAHHGTESCGCLRKERVSQSLGMDLTGKTFGELTVLRKSEKRSQSGVMWICQCSCGAEYEVSGTLLVKGRRTRCGSKIHEKKRAYVDVTGQRFGRLTALYPLKRNDKKGSVIWRCRCDCGNEVDFSYNVLMYSNVRSCGCQKKEHDQKLRTYLTHVAGTSVDILKSKKVPTDNTTGYKGVYLIRGKYVAKIVFQKKAYYLGAYERIEEAAEARKEAEEVLFDGVAEHYRKWKQRADEDPDWAAEHPVEIFVDQDESKRMLVTCLPKL